MIEITHAIARKVLTVVDAGLVSGVGHPKLGKMCVEAAVCFALGEPHGDEPSCVNPALRAFKVGLNDASWSSPTARANGLRRLALAQLGSAGNFDAVDFSKRLAMMTVNKTVPRVLRIAAAMKLTAQNPLFLAIMWEALEKAAVECEKAIDLDAASHAASAASYAASDAASAARDAASVASFAARAARYAASDAARAARDAASVASFAASAASAASDKELSTIAEDVVQLLIAMDAPGCQWLDMAPLAA